MGENLLTDEAEVEDGRTGKELRNAFAEDYIRAYEEFVGPKEYFFQGLVTQDSSVSQSNGPETSSLNGQNFVVCYLPDFQRDFRELSTGALILRFCRTASDGGTL